MSDFDETLNEEELNIITLTDEDGTDKDFEFLDLLPANGVLSLIKPLNIQKGQEEEL